MECRTTVAEECAIQWLRMCGKFGATLMHDSIGHGERGFDVALGDRRTEGKTAITAPPQIRQDLRVHLEGRGRGGYRAGSC